MSQTRDAMNLTCIVCINLQFTFSCWALDQVPNSCSDLLPANYDLMKPPSDHVQTYLQVYVFNIGDIETRDQTFILKMRVIQDWADERLLSSPTLMSYENLRLDPKFHDCFWKPYLRFANLAGEEEIEKNQVFVLRNSTAAGMQLIRRVKFLVACSMDLTWYPMDVQRCWIGFISWSQDGVLTTWAKSSLFNDTLRHESAYDVSMDREENCKYNVKQNSCLKLNLQFKRRLGMYLMTIYFPSCLIVIVAFISFWIDPLSVPGRVSLTVTSLLALMTQFISVRAPLADVNTVTAIDIWFMGCILIVALTMFEFALYHFLSYQAASRANSVISYTSSFSSQHSRDDENGTKTKKEKMKALIRRMLIKCQSKLRGIDFDGYSRLIFPFMFLTYFIIYWTTIGHYSKR